MKRALTVIVFLVLIAAVVACMFRAATRLIEATQPKLDTGDKTWPVN
jgi:hypothetical protein